MGKHNGGKHNGVILYSKNQSGMTPYQQANKDTGSWLLRFWLAEISSTVSIVLVVLTCPQPLAPIFGLPRLSLLLMERFERPLEFAALLFEDVVEDVFLPDGFDEQNGDMLDCSWQQA